MQFTHIIPKKSSIPDYTFIIIKTIVFIVLTGYAAWIGYKKEIFTLSFFEQVQNVFIRHSVQAMLVILLLPLNWGLEALKWLRLISFFEKISFWQSFKGILTGVAFGIATPHGIGDYAGRILQLTNSRRDTLIGAVFLTRITQFAVTILFGTLGLYYYIINIYKPSFLLLYLLLFTAGITILFTLLPLVFHKFLISRLKNFKFIWKYFGVLYSYKRSQVLRIFWLSALRYLVFCLQFVLLFYIFGLSHNWLLLFMAVNFTFLAKSVIPTLFELGVREYAAVYFFSAMGIQNNNIVIASLSLWIVNILLPALIGTLFVFNLKLKLK